MNISVEVLKDNFEEISQKSRERKTKKRKIREKILQIRDYPKGKPSK